MAELAAGELGAPEGGTGTVLPAFENAALGRFVDSVTCSLMESLAPHQLWRVILRDLHTFMFSQKWRSPGEPEPRCDPFQISALDPGNQKQMEMRDAKFCIHKNPLKIF